MTRAEWMNLWSWINRKGSWQKFWYYVSAWIMGCAMIGFVCRGLFDWVDHEANFNVQGGEFHTDMLIWPAAILLLSSTVPLMLNGGVLKTRTAVTDRAARKERELRARESRLLELEAENDRLDRRLEDLGVTV